jgi:hypothetical protein
LSVRFVDELEFALGWIEDEPLARTSHALVADGGVWVIDPVDAPGIDDRLRLLGEPRAVVQLLDRHERDGPALAERLGVDRLEVPFGGVPGSPFEVIPVLRNRFWRELALWWPERRVLVCADALGTSTYFRAPSERLGVHPFLRLFPPRRLGRYEPRHVLVGHGPGVHGPDAADAVRDTLSHARRRLPGALAAAVRAWRPRD